MVALYLLVCYYSYVDIKNKYIYDNDTGSLSRVTSRISQSNYYDTVANEYNSKYIHVCFDRYILLLRVHNTRINREVYKDSIFKIDTGGIYVKI